MIQRQGCHFAVNFQRPGSVLAPGVGGRIGLIETKFVEVVVAGDFIFRRKRQFVLPLGGFRKGERCAGRPFGRSLPLNQSSRSACAAGSEGGGADAKHFQDLAAL
jgi:hypothetical protein